MTDLVNELITRLFVEQPLASPSLLTTTLLDSSLGLVLTHVMAFIHFDNVRCYVTCKRP